MTSPDPEPLLGAVVMHDERGVEVDRRRLEPHEFPLHARAAVEQALDTRREFARLDRLLTKSSAPASRHRTRSISSFEAVMTMIGVSLRLRIRNQQIASVLARHRQVKHDQIGGGARPASDSKA